MSAESKPRDARHLGVSPTHVDFLRCPHAYYKTALTQEPVFLDAETGIYWVMRHDLIRDISKDTETFSSRFDVIADVYKDGMDPEVARIRDGGVTRVDTLLTQDPPLHRTYRELVNMTFAVDKVKAMKPYIEKVASDLIDAFPKEGPVEFVSAFATPLPVRIISDQLGMPVDKVKPWSDAIVDLMGQVGDRDHQIDCATREKAIVDFFTAECAARRVAPKDNIISNLCALTYHPLDGEPRFLDDGEAVSILNQLMVAGNETSTNTIGGGMWYLAQNPDLQARLKAGSEKEMKVFIEEILRVWSPNQGQYRRVKKDTEIEGVFVPKGAILHLRYGAANFDEAVFDCPETIDLDREKPRQHLSFGTGIHTCVGAPLARQELVTGFQMLFARFDNFELAEDPADLNINPGYNLRGPGTLNLWCK